jgi:hypothetical protein
MEAIQHRFIESVMTGRMRQSRKGKATMGMYCPVTPTEAMQHREAAHENAIKTPDNFLSR